ncbi:PREDICTED: uncharacterized protein LOC104704777 [Camelina sativa]|uniref:Uncharacterized protein LOC104704777 n=1 Tax=Camelina sativa TaxID=90675 RepID=A0ABM0T0V1_CAMSA|nr:PREDICTED: uncharacterized protein LOC104704777 [Camelina sativa]
MEKSWVWLPRNSSEYAEGANNDDGHSSGLDAYALFRSAFSDDGDKDSEFCKKLNEAETPMYSTCHNYTKVSAIMGLYRIKVKSGMSENFFDQLLMMVHDMLPDDNVHPKSTNELKRFLKVFGFGYDVIHASKKDCILYRKQYEKMETCTRCSSSRWEIDKQIDTVKDGIPAKVLRYFPIKERFQRMFRSRRIAEELCWHFNNASEDGTIRHPVDSITWAQVNGNCTWPVFLVNYNMSPVMCMKAKNIMLTMLIPGPTAPSNNIDVYLQPLVDELKDLWEEGIEVYDAYLKEKFTLKAILLWSISDYPASGTLSGCKVKGKQACNVCGKDTPHRWLKFNRKHVYLGNRKQFSTGHPYRRRKGWFDNIVEKETARRIQTGSEIFEAIKNFKNDFGKPLSRDSKRKQAELCEDDDLPVRHNIDVMHVEKNLSDAILSIMMNSAKSKDGVKATKDLEEMGIRRNLHTQTKGKEIYLPPAGYWFSKDEKIRFCKRLAKFRGPDGYCANIANCVSLDPLVIRGLKSNEHHVLMQKLLPIALRGLLPKGPRVAITRLCNYFNRLCQRVIDPEKLITLESEFVETMCQMERFFAPSLFYIMFHLPLHLGREARYMKTLKTYVRNFARPEVCMTKAYLAEECLAFCLEFLKSTLPIQEAINRNEYVKSDEHILEDCLLKNCKLLIYDVQEMRLIVGNLIRTGLQVDKSKEGHSTKLRWLAFVPRHTAQSYKGYVINAHRFHRDDVKRITQNSGVTYEAFNMCRSSARDSRQMADMVVYYRVVKEIIILDYHMFQVPLFKCSWANRGYGVKEEDNFTLVNLYMNQSSFLQDPYIMPSQAKQVFYSREDDSSSWYVVMRAPPRGLS